jgi:hypothetical protein
MEEQERLARMGRAPQQTSSGELGGRSGGEDSEGEVDHRQKESLLVMKAKKMQEVGPGLRCAVLCAVLSRLQLTDQLKAIRLQAQLPPVHLISST